MANIRIEHLNLQFVSIPPREALAVCEHLGVDLIENMKRNKNLTGRRVGNIMINVIDLDPLPVSGVDGKTLRRQISERIISGISNAASEKRNGKESKCSTC